MGVPLLRESQKKILISVSISLVYGLCVLFIGLIISFFFYYLGINNPYLNKLRGVLSVGEYQAIELQYGFNYPFSVQLSNYFLNFFNGNWGESFIVIPGLTVTEVMKKIVPKTVETMILPIIIGLVGIKLGRIWVKKRGKIQGFIIQIFTVIGLAMPIFFLTTWLQYTVGITLNGILPVVYYSDPAIPASPFITGFPLFDSIFSGNWELAESIMLHGILPMISLSFVTITLIIKRTQTNIERNSKDTSFVSNSFTAGKMFGILFAFVLITEIIFNRTGFGYYFLISLYSGDIFLLNGCIFMIIILFSFTMFLSNVIPITHKFLRTKIYKKFKPLGSKIRSKFMKFRDEISPPISESKIEVEKNDMTKPKVEVENNIIAKLKKPFRIVGLGLILVIFLLLVIISAFPQIFTPYPLEQIVRPYTPPGGIPFAPPSAEHPLGTTKYGYDILARVIYGTRDALIFGTMVSLIGLAGGSIFGFLAGRLHRYVHNGIIGSMVVFFIIPAILLLSIAGPTFGLDYLLFVIGIGVLLIPIFTQIIANAIRRESNYINAIKVIIKYIPLEMAFAILLYQSLGFIGLMDETTSQLGITLQYGRGSWGALGAIYWPGFFINIIMLSLILLHEGLKAPTAQRDVLNEPVITS